MFCNKCGNKLKQNSTTCPVCGSPVSGDEYCGGFWGLVGSDASRPNVAKAEPKRNSDLEPNRIVDTAPKRVNEPEPRKPNDTPKRNDLNHGKPSYPQIAEVEKRLQEESTKRFRFLFIVCAVLLVIVLLQMFFTLSLSGKVSNMENTLFSLSQTEPTEDPGLTENTEDTYDTENTENTDYMENTEDFNIPSDENNYYGETDSSYSSNIDNGENQQYMNNYTEEENGMPQNEIQWPEENPLDTENVTDINLEDPSAASSPTANTQNRPDFGAIVNRETLPTQA